MTSKIAPPTHVRALLSKGGRAIWDSAEGQGLVRFVRNPVMYGMLARYLTDRAELTEVMAEIEAAKEQGANPLEQPMAQQGQQETPLNKRYNKLKDRLIKLEDKLGLTHKGVEDVGVTNEAVPGIDIPPPPSA